MGFKNLPAGKNAPHDVNAVIEISKGQGHVKYEFDHDTGMIMVDRIRHSSLLYPINYGCIPQTISDDGDPVDVIILGDPVQTGAVLPCRPVGVLMMEDEKGHDVKILAVPSDRLTQQFKHIQDINDIPETQRAMLEHFFTHYKDLDGNGKWSKTSGWQDVSVAHRYIVEGMERAAEMEKAAA